MNGFLLKIERTEKTHAVPWYKMFGGESGLSPVESRIGRRQHLRAQGEEGDWPGRPMTQLFRTAVLLLLFLTLNANVSAAQFINR